MKSLSASPAGRSNILLVSNSPDEMRELLYVLDRHDLGAGLVGDIDAGVALAADGPDLILLDAALAGENIGETCHRLRNASGRHSVPLMLMSGAPSAGEQGRSIGAGAADYIKMPFDARDVAEKILMELALRKNLPLSKAPAAALHPQTLEVNYHSIIAGSPDTILLYDADNACLIDANHNAEQLFGISSDALLQMDLSDVCPPVQADGTPSGTLIAEQIASALAGHIGVFHTIFRHSSDRLIDCEMRMVRLSVPGRQLVHTRITDQTERKLAEALRAGQNVLLEMIAKDAPLKDTLDRLLLLIETQSAGVYCSILLLDEDGRHMHSVSGPSLPPAYMAALEGAEIGPAVGSCGTAMYRKQQVVVSDILQDPLWAPYHPLAAPYGLRACWSMPIIDQGTVLGSFAMYYREVRSPGAEELRLIDVATHIAGIAIGRTRHEQELQRHRAHLEDLVAKRTVALTRAKEQSEQANKELASALVNLSITQDELVRRDKLAALGALVAGVAHELNTPIGNSMVIASTMAERTRLLQANFQDGLRRSELETYLGQAAEADAIVLRNLQRAANLVSSFKQIAVDRASSQRRRFALHDFVADLMLPLCAPLKKSAFTIQQHIPADLLMDSYPGPLGQVLTSLFENCLLHGFEGCSEGCISLRATAGDKGYIALSISDDGVGIAHADLGRIYDPFFTTKLGSGGSGLGLHIAHNIVTGVLGGRIEVDSAPGRGTTFTLQLPANAPHSALQ